MHSIFLPELPPLALYIHFPWCVRKCPYCDFNSHALTDAGVPEKIYLQALLADLKASLPWAQNRRVESIFIGGGTPSLLSPSALSWLLTEIKTLLVLAPDCEITMEANPGTFETDRFHAFRQAGVTRLSLGIQSFNDAKLQALGRIHTAQQAQAAIEEAQRAFNTFNLDLMYALPNQSMSELKADLATALAFELPHLSVYHLTLEANTYFAKYPPTLPDEDLAAQMFDTITQATEKNGLQRYEVSAYARSGHQCKHNRNYWEFGDYLGIGAGAHGKISFPDRIVRHTKHRDPNLYMSKALMQQALASERIVEAVELPFEFMLGALRLKEGVPTEFFTQRTGLNQNVIQPQVEQAISMGLLEKNNALIRTTPKGFDFLSNVQELFLP